MPLQLTTPISAGDLDPSAGSYTQVKVVSLLWREGAVTVTVEKGNSDGGVWYPGLAPVEFTIYDDPAADPEITDYTDLITHVSNDGELTYAAVKRGIYEWLIAKGHYAGTVV
jgi:hypothetical protein